MYMLEYQEPKPVKGIGNTTAYGYMGYSWKQIAMSEDLTALKVIMDKYNDWGLHCRIIKWDSFQVIYKS